MLAAMLTAEVGERSYQLVPSDFREVLNGEELDVLVDHDRRQIRLAGPLADVIREVSAYARETAPAAPIPQNDPPRPVERTARRVPVTISGCFRCYAIAWPWW
jgi:hypothetical protein